jgi:hypothetical protein
MMKAILQNLVFAVVRLQGVPPPGGEASERTGNA